MLFDGQPKMFQILSVLELSWGEANRSADSRPFHALSFRIYGGADFTFQGKTVHCPKNSVAFVPEGISYEMSHRAERLYVVHFKTNKDVEDQLFSFVPHAPHQYQTLFKTMYDIWNAKKEGYYYATMAVFYTILESMQRDMLEVRASQNFEKLDFVMKYIEKNFASESCSVAQMAEFFGSSETYFRRVFKDVYKTTPLKYINNLKMQYALELLRSGYFTVKKAAEKAGYEDVKYFSKFIKKQTGKSPSEYIT